MHEHLVPRRGGGQLEDIKDNCERDETAPLMDDKTSTLKTRAATGARLLAVYLLGWVFILLSWTAVYHIFSMPENNQKLYLSYVFRSVMLSCVAFTMWGLLVKHGPPPSPRDCVRAMACARQAVQRGNWREMYVTASRTVTLRCIIRHIIHYCLIMLPSIALIREYRKIDFANAATFYSNELYLWVALVLWDSVVAYIMTAILTVQAVGILYPQSTAPTAVPAILRRWLSTPSRIAAAVVVFVTLLIAGNMVLFLKTTDDAMEMTRSTVLGEPGKDFCAAYGMQLDPKKLKGGWVLPAVLPRRMFNFYLGSEKCRPAGQVTLGFIDEEAEVLVVPTRCPASVGWRNTFAKPQTPRVYLETPYNNVFAVPGAQFHAQSKVFYELLEAKYRNDTSVIVHRSPSGVIQSVEVKPETLTATDRMAVSDKEKRIRAWWSGESVFVIPLGRSITYTVRCDDAGIDDHFIHPLTPTAPESSEDTTAATAGSTTDEPPANVLAFFFDAVSRQEVVRSLPLFTQWLREYKGYGSHRVLEARSHTTFGAATMRNFATLLSGTSLYLMRAFERYYSPVDFANRTVYYAMKQRYGSRLRTSFNSAFCQDLLAIVFGHRHKAAGYGDAEAGVDQLLLAPLCHLDYASPKLRFESAYGIHKRCIGNTHVHEHQLGYTKALLRQRLREIKASMGTPGKERFFFDMSYFIDGHEATHGMLALMDEALVDFMEELRVDLRFFDNPRNTVVMFSDHGNHMGPYPTFFEGGRIEQTMPFLIFIIHPETFKRVDRLRGWAEGSSEVAMTQRVHNLTTQADLYMTLCDLVGVEPHLESTLAQAPSPPQSLFNPLTAVGHSNVLTQMFSKAFKHKNVTGNPRTCISWCTPVKKDKKKRKEKKKK